MACRSDQCESIPVPGRDAQQPRITRRHLQHNTSSIGADKLSAPEIPHRTVLHVKNRQLHVVCIKIRKRLNLPTSPFTAEIHRSGEDRIGIAASGSGGQHVQCRQCLAQHIDTGWVKSGDLIAKRERDSKKRSERHTGAGLRQIGERFAQDKIVHVAPELSPMQPGILEKPVHSLAHKVVPLPHIRTDTRGIEQVWSRLDGIVRFSRARKQIRIRSNRLASGIYHPTQDCTRIAQFRTRQRSAFLIEHKHGMRQRIPFERLIPP